jgi:DNA-binding NtrC family response regulator
MGSGRRVLIVAPNGDLRGSLVFALEAEGYEVTAKEQVPSLSWVTAQRFDCTVLDQKALLGEPYESIAFCIKAHPVVLLAAQPLSWLVEWVSQVVEMPVAGNAISAAVRQALQIQA